MVGLIEEDVDAFMLVCALSVDVPGGKAGCGPENESMVGRS